MNKCETLKEMVGSRYNIDDEQYIRSFNFYDYGYYINKYGMYQICYISREIKCILWLINLRLRFRWIKRQFKLKKY